jgi:hypothetical protein
LPNKIKKQKKEKMAENKIKPVNREKTSLRRNLILPIIHLVSIDVLSKKKLAVLQSRSRLIFNDLFQVNKYPFMNFPLHINEDIILMKIEGNI